MKPTQFPGGWRNPWIPGIGLLVLFWFSSLGGGPDPDTPQVSYAVVTPLEGQPIPVGGALFRLEDPQGVLLSEAGVGAVETGRGGRIFVDQAGNDTGIALANLSDQSVHLNLAIRDSSGQIVQQSSNQTLAVGAQIALFVNQLFPGLPENFLGSLTFASIEAEGQLAAVTVRLAQNYRGDPIFATLPVVPLEGTSPAQEIPQFLTFPHIGAGGTLSTQLILINPTDTPTSGRVALTASNGSPLEVEVDGELLSEVEFELAAHGVLRVTLNRSQGIVQGFATVTTDAGAPLPAGTAIFQFRNGDGIVSEAGVGALPATVSARIFVDNVATQTGVALANPSQEEALITFLLRDRQGQLLDRQSRTLPPNEHFAIFADEIFAQMADTFSGTLEISSSVPVIPVTLKLSVNSRGDLILTTLPLADPALLAGGERVFPQIGFGGSFSTRLIFLNPSQQDVQGTLRFFAQDGTQLSVPLVGAFIHSTEYRVPPGGSRQFRPGNTAEATQILINPSSVSPSQVSVNLGAELQLAPAVLDNNGDVRDDFEFSYSSVSPEIAPIEAGRVQGLEAGFSTISVSVGEMIATGTITVAEVLPGAEGFSVTGVTQDLAGRLYLTDRDEHTVLQSQRLSEIPEVYAGQVATPGARDDRRLDSLFRNPGFIAYSQSDGSLFVSDTENHTIRRVRPGRLGRVETLAGSPTPGSRDGSLGLARFNRPQGLALDSRGSLWVADAGNHTIRRINLVEGSVSTIAGRAGNSGTADGVGGAARFDSPAGIAVEFEALAAQLERERQGAPPPPISALVVDRGSGRIRRVNEFGQVETLLGGQGTQTAGADTPIVFDAPQGIALDAFGRIYLSEPGSNQVSIITGDGRLLPTAQPGTFQQPRGLAVTQAGKVLVAGGERAAQEIRFGQPELTDFSNSASGEANRITVIGRNFTPDTQVVISGTTIRNLQIVDSTELSFSYDLTTEVPDFGDLTALTLHNQGGAFQETVRIFDDQTLGDRGFLSVNYPPRDASLDGVGNIYVSDDFGGILFLPVGTELPLSIAQNAGFFSAAGSVVDLAGNILVADRFQNQVFRLDRSTKDVTLLAGTGNAGFSGDGGPAVTAELNAPVGVELGPDGSLFVSDTDNHRVRRINLETGIITTVAGNGIAGFQGDGGAATQASLSSPARLDFDLEGNLYIADTGNHRVRRLNTNGLLVTIAGNGNEGSAGDDGPATQAELAFPEGVAVDFDGNVFIAQSGNDGTECILDNSRIRRVDSLSGTITTPVGTDFLLCPTDVFVDGAGNLYIVDGLNFGSLQKFDIVTQTVTTILDGFDAERAG